MSSVVESLISRVLELAREWLAGIYSLLVHTVSGGGTAQTVQIKDRRFRIIREVSCTATVNFEGVLKGFTIIICSSCCYAVTL
jgi:hypothetical protein